MFQSAATATKNVGCTGVRCVVIVSLIDAGNRAVLERRADDEQIAIQRERTAKLVIAAGTEGSQRVALRVPKQPIANEHKGRPT